MFWDFVVHMKLNCAQTSCNILSMKIKVVVVKIYKYFSIYAIRVTELKKFCNEANIEYL